MRKINTNAPVQCSKSVLINASTAQVWKILTAIDQWPRWQNDISSASLMGNVQPQSIFNWKIGGVKIVSTLHTVNPYTEFGWTGKTFGMFAVHNWTLSEVNAQTKVTVDESMEGFLASLFRKSFNKNLEKGIDEWLQALKLESEKESGDHKST